MNEVDARIAPKTRQRVRHIAAEMRYQPNRMARALATGRTQTLALWAANLRSAHYAQVIYHARQEIVRHDYDLLISGAQALDHDTLDTSRLLSLPVDGILAVDLPRGIIPGLEKSLLWDKSFVTMGAHVNQGADFVYLDFLAQSVAAVRHMLAVGCRRIAYLVPDWFQWFRASGDARLNGYETVMAQSGQQPEHIVTPNETRQAVGPVLKEHIARHGSPDGLFCFNDDMAIGAYRALRDLGLRIPDDVALIGCDGIEDAAYLDPSLTTIAQPLEEMCAAAWTFMERRIQNPLLPLQQVTLQPRLIVRGSSQR